MLQVAINGNRIKKESQSVPSSLHEIVEEAVQAVRAGADAIHFHVRDNSGNETLQDSFVSEQLTALRKALPQIPVGISTGEWIEPEFNKRVHYIQNWEVLPDFVSVNCYETRFEKIVEVLLAKAIPWEAGLSSTDAAVRFVLSGLSDTCTRILIEPQVQDMTAAYQTVADIELIIQKVRKSTPILLHGANHTCWPILELAIQKQYATRIGLEDTLYLPNGSKALSNAQLVEKAFSIIQQASGK